VPLISAWIQVFCSSVLSKQQENALLLRYPHKKKSQQLTDLEILLATWNVHSQAAGYKTLSSNQMMLYTPVCYAANQSLHKL
jgi:hypothetical protein